MTIGYNGGDANFSSVSVGEAVNQGNWFVFKPGDVQDLTVVT